MHKNQIIIWVLASFLITYHTVKIYSGLVATDDAAAAVLNWSYENSIRLWIIFSLFLVIMFKRLGVVSMWLSIITLIVMQYISLSGGIQLTAYLGPLKGFIFPVIITWMFWRNQANQALKSP